MFSAKDKDREYFGSPLTEDTPLEYFIPTTTGAGVCTHFLMRFLVDTHNEFLMECDHQLTRKEHRYKCGCSLMLTLFLKLFCDCSCAGPFQIVMNHY